MKRMDARHFRRGTRVAVGCALALAAGAVFAQTSATSSQKIDKIEVTGSSIKQIEGETALPDGSADGLK